MTDEEKKAKRRLGDVVVDKISIVDNPAIGEAFKIVKREPPTPEPVQKDNAPAHEALLNEKLAGLKTATEMFMASVTDPEKMYDCASKIRTLLWAISDAINEMPMMSAEAGKSVSKAIGQEGVCKVLDTLISKKDGGKTMEPEVKKDEAAVAEVKKDAPAAAPDASLVAAVSKSVIDTLKAEGVIKAVEAPKPEPTAAEKEVALLKDANEKLSKRLDDIEKLGVTRTPGGDPTKVVSKSETEVWKGSAFEDLGK